MEPLWAANTNREPYQDARLTINFSNRAVTLDSQSISLTAKEYLLLSFLAAHSGEIFTRTELLLAVWGYGSQIRSRTLDVHLARLRKKLGVFGTATWNPYRQRLPLSAAAGRNGPSASYHASAAGANPLELWA